MPSHLRCLPLFVEGIVIEQVLSAETLNTITLSCFEEDGSFMKQRLVTNTEWVPLALVSNWKCVILKGVGQGICVTLRSLLYRLTSPLADPTATNSQLQLVKIKKLLLIL